MLQFARLYACRFMRFFVPIKISSCVKVFLMKSRLLIVRFMQFDAFIFECVCCFYAHISIYAIIGSYIYVLRLEVPRIPSLNTYAVLIVFMRTLQFTISATQKQGLQLHRKKPG